MLHFAKSRFVCLGVFMMVSLAIMAGTAMAQAQQPAAPVRGAAPTEKMSVGMLEGSVKAVDPGTGTIHVSWGPLGILGKTLEVTDETRIQLEGRQATLADIHEGAKVKETTLVGSLSRWVNRRVFYRAGPNVFGLAEMRKG